VSFIIQGDCAVNFTDHNGKEHFAFKSLSEGDHFGEISVIYRTS
jgi:CRP-like cAMP-binding protein